MNNIFIKMNEYLKHNILSKSEIIKILENNSCVYITKKTSDFLFNENFLDNLRYKFGGNGEKKRVN